MTTRAPHVSAAVPTLKSIQNMVYRAKKRRVAGIQLVDRLDLLHFCRHLVLPHTAITRQIVTNPAASAVAKLMGQDYICIPQDANVFSVDGACFTGPTQIKWMQQLLQLDGHFSLHMDGASISCIMACGSC